MRDFIYRLYGNIQRRYLVKKNNVKSAYQICYSYSREQIDGILQKNVLIVNGKDSNAFPFFKGDNYVVFEERVENINEGITAPLYLRRDQQDGGDIADLWESCIRSARIEEPGWENSGLYLTAYVKEKNEWALSNWIWTSAAIGRVLWELGDRDECVRIADTFIKKQLASGGWIVRYCTIKGKLHRLSAPNDSAYIAANAILAAYDATGDEKYLHSAKRCADWIIDTAQIDGLVYFAYDIETESWIKDRNIVDIGFTGCLFSKLYKITKDERYLAYLRKFTDTYVSVFYDSKKSMFHTHINGDRKTNGGYFSRGQAWALEGLMAAYDVTGDKKYSDIIEKLCIKLVRKQCRDGGWYCNLQNARMLMGQDCKGISVIAKDLTDWAERSVHKRKILKAAGKAYRWCVKHTDEKTGMILSFSSNGAIHHSRNTSTGILYANAYAIELKKAIEKASAAKR